MNSVRNAILKVQNIKSLANPIKSVAWANISRRQFQSIAALPHVQAKSDGILKKLHHFNNCTCCGFRQAHTKAQEELVEFLTDEIIAERKAQKAKTIPTEIEGFKANLDGAEVTFTKQLDNETIRIKFNVNHSVDTDPEPGINQDMEKPELGELKSRPDFKVEIVRGDTTLSLDCSFTLNDHQEEEYNDVFGIDEISIYHGVWKPNAYSVSGEVVDLALYDLLLNYLDEKGITNTFVEKLSNYSTAYEHSAYISLLEGLSKFASNK